MELRLWRTPILFCSVLMLVYCQDELDAGGDDLSSLIDAVFSKPPNAQTPSPVSSNTPTPTPTPKPGINLQPDVESHSGVNSYGEECECVPYYLCNNGTINKNGEGIIDIRINDGPCATPYIEVCCSKDNKLDEPVTPAPRPKPSSECGIRNSKGIGFRITGAKDGEAQFGEFPWMIAILREESVEGNPVKLNVYQCGGALIHPSVVLTAAHCVEGKNKVFKIRAGEWDTQHEKELFPFQDREVESIKIHPDYYRGTLRNDVAMVFLKTPVEPAEHIGHVCLPPQDTTPSGRGYATGWGKDQFGKKGKYQVILKKIDLPVVAREDCQSRLRSTRLGKYFELHKSFMCAGGEPNKDTCKGDGGSPLVIPIDSNDEKYYQAGIVAWGIGCGENNIPGVYVQVSRFRDWIDTQMRQHNYETNTYSY